MKTFKHAAFFLTLVLCLVAVSTAQTKPALTAAAGTKIRLAYKGRTALVDLDNTDNVTLGGDKWHRFKLFFSTVKDGHVFFLFQEQGGSPMSDRNGPCGNDQPRTVIWLKADLNLKVVEAKSEVFASCSFNGGRYLQGSLRLSTDQLSIVFEEHRIKHTIVYDNKLPENSFTVT